MVGFAESFSHDLPLTSTRCSLLTNLELKAVILSQRHLCARNGKGDRASKSVSIVMHITDQQSLNASVPNVHSCGLLTSTIGIYLYIRSTSLILLECRQSLRHQNLLASLINMKPLLALAFLSLLPSLIIASAGYGTITTTAITPSIIRATINNPPINIYDYALAADLYSFITSLNPNSTKVVILSSSNPDFWISHYDIHLLSSSDPAKPPSNGTTIAYQILESVRLLSTLPIIFIAEINARASGAGDEILLQCDMRFAGPQTRLSQFEIGFGLLPGAGGVQYLVSLIGRARALEYILSGNAVDALTAAHIGWVNRAYPTGQELKEGVETLARRIAAFPAEALGVIKARINVRGRPSQEILAGDNAEFLRLTQTPVSMRAADKFLKLSDEESRSMYELGVPSGLEELVM